MHVAIVGCGQLSRMLALAGLPLSIKFTFISDIPSGDTRCVDGLGNIVDWKPGDSIDDLRTVLGNPDVITVEKEQLQLSLLEQLDEYYLISPCVKAVAACQHRYREKQLLDSLAIPCSTYTYNQSAKETVNSLSLPLVAKSCSDGYDGKNQWVLKTDADVEVFDEMNRQEDIIIEQWIGFSREVSQVSVRNSEGQIEHYPLAENQHENGILKQSIVPAIDASQQLVEQAQDYISRIMNELDYVGVIAMECFETEDGLMVNELAPRVHNSGHWSQQGSKTSQFENHIRAITGLPLGCANVHGVAGMLNLIGTEKPPLDNLTKNSTLHWYNKTVRPGRKLGHVNFTEDSHEELIQQMNAFQKTSGI